MNAFRLIWIMFLWCILITGSISCSRNSHTKGYEKKLFAPLSEQEIDHLVHSSRDKHDLLERCGTPLRVERSNGVERIEFMVSFDRVQGPTPLMIASFVVVVSNNTVVSWYPRSQGRIR